MKIINYATEIVQFSVIHAIFIDVRLTFYVNSSEHLLAILSLKQPYYTPLF